MFKIKFNNNEKLEKVYNIVKEDKELHTYWSCSNITAIDRLHLTDHGRVHIAIVTNRALKILRMLHEHGVVTGIEKDHKLKYEDAEVLVFLAAILHDIGQIVHRDNHALIGAALAPRFTEKYLDSIYSPEDKARMTSDICHAIFTHRESSKPLTIEAGVIRVADALDMEKGRAEISFSLIGSTSIHSVSAMAIKEVEIIKGVKKPIRIKISMANSSGIFQIDELLRHKLKNSMIEEYIEVHASIDGEEEKLIDVVEI
ncbi:MAG: HD domain-containing protein [Candidatus Muirbacterium halophilum]|nr:HD domain-containing protein [Candidatus Muirbacterium halophilum]MCK9476484.1 HD domain-containing protein [Candidatus Muirbacterium halophilum]